EGIIELNAVVVKACNPDARQRYQSADQMHDDLLLRVAGKSIRRTHALERRLVLMTRIGAATAVVLLLSAVPFYWAIKEARLAKASAKTEAEQHRRADSEAARARIAEADA